MSRRTYAGRYPCKQEGCRERSNYEFDTRREQAEFVKDYLPWACIRHTQPDEVLSLTNAERSVVLVASKVRSHNYERNLADYQRACARGSDFAREPQEYLDGLFWLPEGEDVAGSGFNSGPGYKAWATDFPEGTRLVITARVAPPTPAVVPAGQHETEEQ